MTLAIAIENRLESQIARAIEIIEHVRDRPKGLNEADTEAAFIDPILSALGWELRDPFSVSQQYRHKPQANPVDYALFILRAPVMFVEAKALNKDLSGYKRISQTRRMVGDGGDQARVARRRASARRISAMEGPPHRPEAEPGTERKNG